jgi:hypothetical protein
LAVLAVEVIGKPVEADERAGRRCAVTKELATLHGTPFSCDPQRFTTIAKPLHLNSDQQ